MQDIRRFQFNEMDRRAIKTQMINTPPILDILTDVDDTKGGYSTISIAFATELLTEVVETYVTTRFDNVNRITHSYVHLEKEHDTHTTNRYGSIINNVYKSENSLAKCESMWMQSPSHVFNHPLWQDKCFRDGDKIPLRKAINEASSTISVKRRCVDTLLCQKARQWIFGRKRINPKEKSRIKRQRCHVPMTSRPQ